MDGSQFCHACFGGEYPVPVDPTAGKLTIGNMHKGTVGSDAG